MSVRKIDQPEAGRYLSGLAQDGWEHLNDSGVRSSLERLQPKYSERLIIPGERRIFLFVLSGALRVDAEPGELRVGQGEAVEALPGSILSVRNSSARAVQYLLVSAPARALGMHSATLESQAGDGMIRAA